MLKRIRGKVQAFVDDHLSLSQTCITLHINKPFTSKKILIYSLWSQNGRVSDYVLEQLRYYKNKGFDIAACDTSDQVAPETIDAASGLVCKFVHRRNIGLDFCSHALVLQLFPEIKNADVVVFTNDSVFGPFTDFLDKVFATPGDVVGLTDSFEHSYHLQSYFLMVRKHFLASAAFSSFWEGVRPRSDKFQVIIKYEVGFSTFAQSAGFVLSAVYPYASLLRTALATTYVSDAGKLSHFRSPVLYFWDILLEEKLDFPFLKRELLSKNVIEDPDLHFWFEHVRNKDQVTLIRSYYNKHTSAVLMS